MKDTPMYTVLCLQVYNDKLRYRYWCGELRTAKIPLEEIYEWMEDEGTDHYFINSDYNIKEANKWFDDALRTMDGKIRGIKPCKECDIRYECLTGQYEEVYE